MTLYELGFLGATVPRSWRAVADIIGVVVIVAIAFLA
jgi:hypothetical protein